MTVAAAFTTSPVDVWELEPGDTYIVGTVGGARETREVLGILQRTPMHGALLEVRDPRGDVFRSHMSGRVDVVEREPIDTAELRAALAAGADFAGGSEILAARVLAAAAHI